MIIGMEVKSMRDLAIIILNYNGSADTIECIESLSKSKTQRIYDIYILDNASQRKDIDILEQFIQNKSNFKICSDSVFVKEKLKGNLLILSDENLGFARGNNKIIHEIYKEYSYILLLNNDTIVHSNFIERMLNLLNADKTIGFASCRINNYYNRDILWNCGGLLKIWGLRKYYCEEELKKMPNVIDAEFITGCALFISSFVIEKYGALSENFFHGEEDFNFCWRMKKNHIKGKCLNQTLVYHKESATSKKDGELIGKKVCYYVYRIVDMKQFYVRIIWHIWKFSLICVLILHWRKDGYSKEEIRKMLDIIKRASKLESINREETLKIWDLTY